MSGGALQGIVVLDVTQALAGPFASMILGDIGADVIKIELPGGGDGARRWGPPFAEGSGPTFVGFNRNKRSVALDLRTDEGREGFKALVAKADVVLENFRPRTMDRFGVGYDVLREIRPDLVYCSISGYGQTGPLADRAAMDLMIQAVSGMMSVTGEPEGRPVKGAAPVADLMGGFSAGFSILAAIRERDRTGQGQKIDISMLDAMITVLGQAVVAYTMSGNPPQRQGNAHHLMAPYQSFQTATKDFVISLTTQKRWEQFCTIGEFEHLLAQQQYLTQELRNANRGPLCAELQNIFLTDSCEYWMDQFLKLGLPTAPVNAIPDILAEPHLEHRGTMVEVEYPDGSGHHIRTPGLPWRDVASDRPLRNPPTLGQHTEEVFREFGLDVSAISPRPADASEDE